MRDEAGASKIAIIGAGPAGLVMAIALARRGISSRVFERDPHPADATRFDPDRSYAIDITGHGYRALRHIDACAAFDEMLLPFKGIRAPRLKLEDAWEDPGWTGSRGDILRALMHELEAHHAGLIDCSFDTRVTEVDVTAGQIVAETDGQARTEYFDLIIGADGGGSLLRRSMEAQVEEFHSEYEEIPNYATMLELDQGTDDLDPRYLYIFSDNPFCIAGAINGEPGTDSVRWFCVVGTDFEIRNESVDDARRLLGKRAAPVLEMVSEEALEAFSRRKCYHIGKMRSCSQLYGGKAVLLGDAAAPFSPIGQGINAAMESAMVLDQCMEAEGPELDALHQAAERYSARWKPEADAVTWICKKFIYGRNSHLLRMHLTSLFGANALSNAKKTDMSYVEARKRAERLGPVWR